ncbi:MAG: TIGR00730 family Rossman fold protein [Prevotella sp.]|nr:TIGR00730 family Rossman fold protein [Prevotella sp.]
MRVAVYCSANSHIDKEYIRLTEELGHWLAQNGHILVFGGTDLGLMETIAKAVKEECGRCIGVVPSKVEERGHVSSWLDERIDCDNLSDRKDLMLQQSDIAIALPGGIGTLDEVFSMAASATIGYHHKRVILYNMNGFWNSLVDLLEHLQAQRLMRGSYKQFIQIASNLDELSDLL